MTNDDLLEKGTQAEQAKPYLVNLVTEATSSLSEQLLRLYPNETIKFSAIRSQMMALDDILGVVENDIIRGKEALAQIQGEQAQKGGIL